MNTSKSPIYSCRLLLSIASETGQNGLAVGTGEERFAAYGLSNRSAEKIPSQPDYFEKFDDAGFCFGGAGVSG
ncbi:hypothetical protein QS306_06210 [Paraburkholderia bonniea]|uniref:hypothetical protein n=1 Tax=Paraburkholderia bonniea TaxID=2152891 RepID=UPI0012925C0D|nr:hypothetical protein [Paraburkholderia bonniea]WJF91225.1 hypothetical protein QS306_06210 [Paraburkholderia bonniea]WJF94540.1 hypothetical protein QS308_06220 [Paraburkholderia bonniea]